MYIKLNNGVVEKYPYTIKELKNNNKNVSFPANITNEILATFEVFEVIATEKPSINEMVQKVVEETPNEIEGKWYQDWAVVDLSADDIALNIELANEMAEINRSDAYRNESDPLFFKWQRGESTEQIWLDKVAEIKVRFPKVE